MCTINKAHMHNMASGQFYFDSLLCRKTEFAFPNSNFIIKLECLHFNHSLSSLSVAAANPKQAEYIKLLQRPRVNALPLIKVFLLFSTNCIHQPLFVAFLNQLSKARVCLIGKFSLHVNYPTVLHVWLKIIFMQWKDRIKQPNQWRAFGVEIRSIGSDKRWSQLSDIK